MSTRNIKTREGYDMWDKLCAIPRYGFIHSPDNSLILKAEGLGNWIDRDEAMKVMDDAQSKLNELRERLARLAPAPIEQPAPVSAPDSGPWVVSASPDGKRVSLQSDDFTHDVALLVTGDFVEGDKLRYGKELAEWMNGCLAQKPAPVSVDERAAFEAWAKDRDWFVPLRSVKERDDSVFEYADPVTDHNWIAWQARAALSQPSTQADAVSVPRELTERLLSLIEMNIHFENHPENELRALLATRQGDKP